MQYLRLRCRRGVQRPTRAGPALHRGGGGGGGHIQVSTVKYSTVQYSTVQYSDLQAAARPRLCHGQLPGVLARPLQRAPTPGSQGGGEHHGLVAGRAVRGSDGGGGG